MKLMIKIAVRLFLGGLLLAAGFATGYPMGRQSGFSTGTEWALMQADILAREAGLIMPVFFENNEFKVVLKQPRHLYRTAWKLSDRFDIRTGVTIKTVEKTEDESICADETVPQKEELVFVSSGEVKSLATETSDREQPLHADQAEIKTF